MENQAPPEGKLEFYVVNNLRFQQMDEQFTIQRHLTLPQAIALYGTYRPNQVSAIGATLNDRMDTDIVQQRDGMNVLVSDYQRMACWKYNPELCVSAVSMLIGTLGIKQQFDNGALFRPLADRLHIMQLKYNDDTRNLRWEGLDTVERMGLKVDMRNYELVYSEDVRENEMPNQLYQRLNTEAHPEGYRGYSLSMSDVIVYQNKKGCTAYYVDEIGFTMLRRFIKPPGELDNAKKSSDKKKYTSKEER